MGAGDSVRDNSQQKPDVCTNVDSDTVISRNLAASIFSSQFAALQDPCGRALIFGPFGPLASVGLGPLPGYVAG